MEIRLVPIMTFTIEDGLIHITVYGACFEGDFVQSPWNLKLLGTKTIDLYAENYQ